jgi:ubiquitin-protein ligase
MNSCLKKDVEGFLETYFNFSINAEMETQNCLVLDGVIDVIDMEGVFWQNYEVRILFPKLNYPNVIPEVYEISSKIDRAIKFHIDTNGKCCLDIYHKLVLEQRRGINIIEFYKKFVYPFFANHQFKIKTDSYAAGEYKHDIAGVVQYYKDEFDLTDFIIIKKHKKCCFMTVEKLKSYGNKLLIMDLKIFNEKLSKLIL